MGFATRNTTGRRTKATQSSKAEFTPPTAKVVRSMISTMAKTWPDAVCELEHSSPYHLIVGTILAAQSTDKLVNTITPGLFERWPTATALASADIGELEVVVHSTGFYRMKAKNLLGMARKVVAEHGGEIPRTMAELVELPGVARKTANVVLGTCFGIGDGFVVDTHVTRLSQRLGLTQQTDPVKIENDLVALVPKADRISFGNRIIWHGRRVCHARKPLCGECGLAPVCPSADMLAGSST